LAVWGGRVQGENGVTSGASKKKSTKKKRSTRHSKVGVRNKPLSALTDEALRGYFNKLNGHKPGDLYQLVLGEVEKPLFRAVLDYTNGNQSEAAEILGINRGTLRKKLRAYNLIA
jgi:Fis family transcriptional regulator, factor for inversion stimulation protein